MAGLDPAIQGYEAPAFHLALDGRLKGGHDGVGNISMPGMPSVIHEVVAIEAVPPFGIRVRFNDGSMGVHDCSRDIISGPMSEPLRDQAYFARVTLDHGAPTWPNGFDMCPDWLRQQMEAAGELSRAAAE
jgi:Protein of unknown function (DUF2442)